MCQSECQYSKRDVTQDDVFNFEFWQYLYIITIINNNNNNNNKYVNLTSN